MTPNSIDFSLFFLYHVPTVSGVVYNLTALCSLCQQCAPASDGVLNSAVALGHVINVCDQPLTETYLSTLCY